MLTPSQIKALRQAMGQTRMAFATALGLKTEQAIYQWESGRRHPRYEYMVRLNELAKQHGIDLDKLASDEPSVPPQPTAIGA